MDNLDIKPLPKTPKDKLNNLDQILDDYESGLGLPSGDYPHISEVSTYLNFGRNQLEALTPQDAGQIAYILGSYSIFLQRAINRENARVNWATALVKEVTANQLDSYSGYGYEEKFQKAIKGDDYAHKLSEIVRYAKQRSDRLSFVASGVKNLADILVNMMRLRRE